MIIAVLGPTIGQAAYEVGPEFLAQFGRKDEGNSRFFRPSAREGYSMFDLPGYIGARLAICGIGEYADLSLCTYSDEERFFSYRRATHRGEADYGRLISAIALTP
jgi:copper oxidase (laccase) domain-containing protein